MPTVSLGYEGVKPILELFLVLELKITCFYVILASILCHGKAMSACEIDMGAIQLLNLGDIVRNLPYGISEDLGATKFVGA